MFRDDPTGHHASCVYFGRCLSIGPIKIGTTRTIPLRVREIAVKHKYFEVFAVRKGSYELEQTIHNHFGKDRVRRNDEKEWFRPTDYLKGFILATAKPYGPEHLMPDFLEESWTIVPPEIEPHPECYTLNELCDQLYEDKALITDLIKCERISPVGVVSGRSIYSQKDLERLRILVAAWNNKVYIPANAW